MANSFLSHSIDYASLSAQSLTSVLLKTDNVGADFNIKFEPSVSGFEDFVFFGSASAIANIAINKILVTYPINDTTSSTTASSSAYEKAQKYINTYSKFERTILNGFTDTLTGTYNDLLFSIPNIKRNADYSLSSLNDQIYVNSIISDAVDYDEQNRNTLQGFVPSSFIDYDENDILKNIVNLWGNIFDEILLYINKFTDIFTISYEATNRQRGKDVYNLLTLLNFKLHTNYIFNSLLEYLVGTDTIYSQKAIQIDIWNRILNNLIYIYKTKGTIESIKAFLNCLGLNTDLISVKEYVTYNKPTYVDTLKEYKYFSLQFDSSTASYISSSANGFNLSGSEWSVILNFELENKRQNQFLFGRTNQYSVGIYDVSTTSDYNEIQFSGYVSFTGNLSNGTTLVLTSSTGNIFTNGVQTLIVNKSTTGYSLHLNRLDDNYNFINLNASTSVTSGLTSINNNVFYLGKTWETNDNKFVGSIINLKVFNTSLSSEQINLFSKSIGIVNLTTEQFNNNILVNWELNEPLYSAYRSSNFSYTGTGSRIILDSSTGFDNGSSTGYINFDDAYFYKLSSKIYPFTKYVSGLSTESDKININSTLHKNDKSVSIEINPVEKLNEQFEFLFGPIDFFDYFSSSDLNANSNKYSGLETLKTNFFNSNINIFNFSTFITDVEKYAVGLFKSFYQFLPANANILYNGIVIESPVYDRNKHIYRNLELTTITASENAISAMSLENELVSPLTSDILAYSSLTSFINNTNIFSEILMPSASGYWVSNYDISVVVNMQSEKQSDSVIDTNSATSTMELNYDYLYNKSNLFSSFRLDNDLISAIETQIDDIYGKLSISGDYNIYLGDDLTGETEVIINYFDTQRDNILGTKFILYQNINNIKSAFDIVDIDNSITSNSYNQTFFINDYDGANIKFKFDPSIGFVDSINNKILINNIEKEFTININWIPNTTTIFTNAKIQDAITITKYPLLRWNLSTDISTISSISSNYGTTLTSSYYSTTATYTAGSGVFININNYSPYVECELNLNFTVSGQQNVFRLLDVIAPTGRPSTELKLGLYGDTNDIIFIGNSTNILRTILAPNCSKTFLLDSNIAAGSISATTSGEFSIYTNQYISDTENKIFKLNFIATANTIGGQIPPGSARPGGE